MNIKQCWICRGGFDSPGEMVDSHRKLKKQTGSCKWTTGPHWKVILFRCHRNGESTISLGVKPPFGGRGCQVWRFWFKPFWFYRADRHTQTVRITESQMQMIAILTRLPSASVINLRHCGKRIWVNFRGNYWELRSHTYFAMNKCIIFDKSLRLYLEC